MQKIFLLALPFLIFFLSFNFNVSFAKENASPSADSQDVHYELPYPGLLPDSPLYFLRIIRDKAVGFLISAPLKKAEFNLLQADKRLNAGVYLFNKHKIPLAISTISKAENYFYDAIQKAQIAKKEGEDITQIIGELLNSSKKHQEVLEDLREKSLKEFKEGFEEQRQRAADFELEAQRLPE